MSHQFVIVYDSFIMSNWSNANLWVTDWILCSFWSADDSVNILDSSGQESTECSLKLIGSSSCETSKIGLTKGQILSFGVTGVITCVVHGTKSTVDNPSHDDPVFGGQIWRQTCNQDHERHEAYQWLEYPKQRFGSENVAWKMLHEKCCTKNVAFKCFRDNFAASKDENLLFCLGMLFLGFVWSWLELVAL